MNRQNSLISFLINRCFLVFCVMISNMSYGLIIDRPGTYQFGGDLIETGTDVIIIQSDNVVVDLEGNIFAGGTNGIVIDPGFSGITIKNGTIANITGAGISIGHTCSSILLQNLTIALCGGAAIELIGTSTANLVTNVHIENLGVNQCALSLFANSVLSIVYGENVTIIDTRIVDSGNGVADLIALNLVNSQRILSNQLGILNSQGASFTGVSLTNSQDCVFGACRIVANRVENPGGDLVGCKLRDNSINNLFSECLILTNSGQGYVCGFDIGHNCVCNAIGSSRVAGNQGDQFHGCVLRGSGTPSDNRYNTITDTFVVQNRATGTNAVCTGFCIIGADAGAIRLSVAGFNLAPMGQAYGLLFSDAVGTGGNEWSIFKSQFIQNTGMDDANSFGIAVQQGTGSLLSKNLVYGNGSLPSNQITGFLTDSIVTTTTGSLNSVTAPWSNIVVTS